jgi:hypothetical protein
MSAYVVGDKGNARPLVFLDEDEFYKRIAGAGLNDGPNPRRLFLAGHAFTLRAERQTLIELGVWEPAP